MPTISFMDIGIDHARELLGNILAPERGNLLTIHIDRGGEVFAGTGQANPDVG